jgi:hypothetical protein
MPATRILLIGAGFSRNWGAPLASEVANALMRAVEDDAYLRDLLARHAKNFENALSEVQRDYISGGATSPARAHLEKLQAAIGSMFDRLNATFEDHAFEFINERRYSASEFLAGFDAIFSLNQDLLLELGYAQQVLTASNTRWNGLEMVGMTPVFDPALTGIGDKHKRRWRPLSPPFASSARFQPYFKIHGVKSLSTATPLSLPIMTPRLCATAEPRPAARSPA